jgi:hypothetical protein
MHSPTRDPVREYQKQKEKLALIGLECIIEWTKKTLLTRQAKASQLNEELDDIHQYLRALKDEKGVILEDLSQQSTWTKPEGQRRTLKLLDLNSKYAHLTFLNSFVSIAALHFQILDLSHFLTTDTSQNS